MKKSAVLLSVLVLPFALAVGAVRVHGATPRVNHADGALNAPAAGVVSPLYLKLEITGDTTGVLEATIDYNNSRHVVGGEWTLTTTTSNPDGSVQVAGTLRGTFDGGDVVMSSEGALASVKAATLAIDEAAGTYSGAAPGTGTLEGTFDPSLNFSGAFSLSF